MGPRLPDICSILSSKTLFCWMKPNMAFYRIKEALHFLGPKLNESKFCYLIQATWLFLKRLFVCSENLQLHMQLLLHRDHKSIFFSPKFLGVTPELWKTTHEAGNKKNDFIFYIYCFHNLKVTISKRVEEYCKLGNRNFPYHHSNVKTLHCTLELFIHLLNSQTFWTAWYHKDLKILRLLYSLGGLA